MIALALLCTLAADAPFDPLGAPGSGRVFAEKPGGKVAAKAGKKTLQLDDGERVKYIDDDGGAGMGTDTTAAAVARKAKLNVPNGQVIIEDRLHRSPDGKWGVFSATVSCGDFCYANGWLFGPGRRLRLSEQGFGTDVVAAWRSDGKEVAVGSRGLWLIALPEAKPVEESGYCAPAYNSEGRLFVRGCGSDSDAVFEWVPGGKPRQVLAGPGKPYTVEDADLGDPPPVTFAADGTLTAVFEREGNNVERRLVIKPLKRPEAVDKALASLADSSVPPARARDLAIAQGEAAPAFAHELAVAANTRGYRLYQEGKLDDALPLFIAAATLDVTYGMPRYNLARLHAMKGDAKESGVYLNMLRIMGRPQRERLEQARKDEAFKKIAGTPEFEAAFR
jgi:hypothetical protein